MPTGVYPRSKSKVIAVRPEVKVVLPDCCQVVERSNELELMFRTKNKWLPFAKQLQSLSGMQALQIELGDLKDLPNSKSRINSIKGGIRKAWQDLGGKGRMMTGVHGGKLYVWINGR